MIQSAEDLILYICLYNQTFNFYKLDHICVVLMWVAIVKGSIGESLHNLRSNNVGAPYNSAKL